MLPSLGQGPGILLCRLFQVIIDTVNDQLQGTYPGAWEKQPPDHPHDLCRYRHDAAGH